MLSEKMGGEKKTVAMREGGVAHFTFAAECATAKKATDVVGKVEEIRIFHPRFQPCRRLSL